jgi:CheY-like chemotaxis protein
MRDVHVSLKILLADDSMTAQNMGKKILTDAGYEVVAVSNGAAAVKKIAEHKPDLAILDIYMPGYTGLEVCERVKGTLETSRMPVLLTVGKMEPYRVEDGARVRSDGVIVKPFEASDLIAAVEKLSQKLGPAQPAWKRESNESADDPNNIETSSFQALKSEESPENTGPERFTLSQEMQSTPAMDFASIGIEPVQHEIVSAAEMAIGAPAHLPEPEFAAENSGIPWQPAGFVVEEMHSIDQEDEPMFASSDTLDPVLDTPPPVETSSETSAGIQPFEVEFNSAPQVGEIEVEAAPELEPDTAALTAQVETVTDPALLTPVEVANEFPTAFGSEIVAATELPHSLDASDDTTDSSAALEIEAPAAEAAHEDSADEFESRVAAAMAAYERLGVPTPNDSQPAPLSSWRAEQVEVEASEATVSLEAELAEHFPAIKFSSSPDFEPTPSIDSAADSVAIKQTTSLMIAEAAAHEMSGPPEIVTQVEVSQPEAIPESIETSEPETDHSTALAAAATFGGFAIAAEPESAVDEAQSAGAVSAEDDRIANAIQRVLERLKPQIVSEIARELSKKDEN